jgi:hypothetical protein
MAWHVTITHLQRKVYFKSQEMQTKALSAWLGVERGRHLYLVSINQNLSFLRQY